MNEITKCSSRIIGKNDDRILKVWKPGNIEKDKEKLYK